MNAVGMRVTQESTRNGDAMTTKPPGCLRNATAGPASDPKAYCLIIS
jgi:hypothetical protein